MQFKPGDKVKFIDEDNKGTVLRVSGSRITILDENGFEEIVEDFQIILDTEFENEVEWNSKFEREEKDIKQTRKKNKNQTLIVDLHFSQLDDFDKNLSHHLILQRQMNHAKTQLNKAKEEGFWKIIFIHGKGKGVLEKALKDWLYEEKIGFEDADFRLYKLGAIEIKL